MTEPDTQSQLETFLETVDPMNKLAGIRSVIIVLRLSSGPLQTLMAAEFNLKLIKALLLFKMTKD